MMFHYVENLNFYVHEAHVQFAYKICRNNIEFVNRMITWHVHEALVSISDHV